MPNEVSEEVLSQYYNCLHCGQCCNFFEMIINPDHATINNLSIREAFKKELQIEFGCIYNCSIKISSTCIHLDAKTGLCKIYDTRPSICRNHFCQRYPKIEDE